MLLVVCFMLCLWVQGQRGHMVSGENWSRWQEVGLPGRLASPPSEGLNRLWAFPGMGPTPQSSRPGGHVCEVGGSCLSSAVREPFKTLLARPPDKCVLSARDFSAAAGEGLARRGGWQGGRPQDRVTCRWVGLDSGCSSAPRAPLCRPGPPQPGLSCLHARSTLPCPLMVMLVSQTQEAPRGGVHDPNPRRGADAALLAAEPPARGWGLGVGGLSVPGLPRISLPRPRLSLLPLGLALVGRSVPGGWRGSAPGVSVPPGTGRCPAGQRSWVQHGPAHPRAARGGVAPGPRPRDSRRGSVCPVSKPPWGGKGHAADSLFLRPTLLCPRAAPTLNSPLHPSAPGSPQYSAYPLGRERTTQPSSG